MLILALDSSGPALSVALRRDKRLIAERYLDLGLTHSETLLPTVEAILASCKLSYSDLDLLAVTAGPGSYTGLRIGLTTMKTLAYVLGKPLYPISTLAALACPWQSAGLPVLALLDARGGRVYSELYEAGLSRLPAANRQLSQLQDDLLAAGWGGRELRLAGSGAVLFRQQAAETFTCVWDEASGLGLQAATVALLAEEAYERAEPAARTLDLDATYLAPSQAERLAGTQAGDSAERKPVSESEASL